MNIIGRIRNNVGCSVSQAHAIYKDICKDIRREGQISAIQGITNALWFIIGILIGNMIVSYFL